MEMIADLIGQVGAYDAAGRVFYVTLARVIKIITRLTGDDCVS
jgi:hypothetical protein